MVLKNMPLPELQPRYSDVVELGCGLVRRCRGIPTCLSYEVLELWYSGLYMLDERSN